MAERSIWEQAYGRLATPDFAAPSQAVQSVRNPGPMVGRGNLASFDFSWRDMTRQWLKSLGISDNMVKNTMTLVDFTPAGAAFVGNEARRSYDRGERLAPAAEVALAALPLPVAARKGVAKAVREVAEEVPTIIAYHGSPHSFDRFDMSKIGTGEGAQAYGHGLYFAEAEDTARSYRDALTTRGDDATGWNMTVRGKRVEDIYSQIEQRAARMPIKDAQFEYDKLSAIESLMQHGDPQGVVQSGQIDGPALDWFNREIAPNFKRDGSMYQVRIDADPADFLDWDAPLSGQSEKVRAAMQPFVGKDAQAKMGYRNPDKMAALWDDPSGNFLYSQAPVTGKPPFTAEADEVSQALLAQGIPGIKYLDQGSRAAGQGSRNFVVFDDKLVTILKKYGWVPGMAIPAMAVRDYTAMYGVAPDLGGETPSVTVY